MFFVIVIICIICNIVLIQTCMLQKFMSGSSKLNNLSVNSLSFSHSQSIFSPNILLTMKLFCFFNFTASELTTLGLGDELDSVEILRQRKLHSNITRSPITNRELIKSYVKYEVGSPKFIWAILIICGEKNTVQ
jgi:hypothetical protein